MNKELLDKIIEKAGGKDKLVKIVQERLKHFYKGGKFNADNRYCNLIEIVVNELAEKVDSNKR